MESPRDHEMPPNRDETLSCEDTLRARLASLDAGEPGVPAEQVLAEVRDQIETLSVEPDDQ